MSLKLAVVGSLLNALGTRARAEGQTQNLELVGSHDEPLPTNFCRWSSAAEPEKSEAGRAIDGKQEVRD